jgi:prepilin-type N-terminal cleavage/methylation domain-containing protein
LSSGIFFLPLTRGVKEESSFYKEVAMRKGFTLLELIIVVIIVAILAGLGIPQFIRTVDRARASEASQILGAVRSAQLRYYAEWNDYYRNTTSCAGIDIGLTALRNFDVATLFCNGTATVTAQVTATAAKFSTGAFVVSISPAGVLSCTGGCPPGFPSNP